MMHSDFKYKNRRGRARNHMQLSQQQRDILEWLSKQERHITQNGKRKGGTYSKRGIRWSSERFFKTKPTQAQRSSLSRSIRNLARRGLIDLDKGNKRTLFIKINSNGHHAIDADTIMLEKLRRAEHTFRYFRNA